MVTPFNKKLEIGGQLLSQTTKVIKTILQMQFSTFQKNLDNWQGASLILGF